ncbi:MAG: hypothetical protein ACPGD8_09055 [Flavobacteriales bacterium]
MNPYLSIVVAVRNDNYGGNFTQRLQRSLDWNTKWLEFHKVQCEMILVNWNPVPGNPSLKEVIVWPKNRSYVKFRIITVPTSIHQKFVKPAIRETVPLFEFIAKNVGIRRANAEQVLSTNADILLHPDICRLVGQMPIELNRFYRANRLDFRSHNITGVSSLLKNGFAISLKGFMYSLRPGLNKTIQFEVLKGWNNIRVWWELLKSRHPNFFTRKRINVMFNNGGLHSHCLNSGDFMLMTKENWVSQTAYPEHTPMALHTDALFNVLASEMLEEKVFDSPIFHQEHERRYPWDSSQTNLKYKEAYVLFEQASKASVRGEPTASYRNSSSWGLPDVKLQEEVI